MPKTPPLLPPALATSLAAWLAIFSTTLWSITSRPRPEDAARSGLAATMAVTMSAPFVCLASQRPEVKLALEQPTDHQPDRREQQDDHERAETGEDGHHAE